MLNNYNWTINEIRCTIQKLLPIQNDNHFIIFLNSHTLTSFSVCWQKTIFKVIQKKYKFYSVFGNLIHPVGVGVVLACVFFMKRESDLAERGTTLTPLGSSEDEELWEDEKSVYNEYNGKIFIMHMSGPMFFGFTSRFQELAKEFDPGI